MENRLDNIEKIMEKYNDFKDSLVPKASEELETEILEKKIELEKEEKILDAFKEELNSLDTTHMDYVQMHVTIGNYNRYILESKQKIDLLKKEYKEKLNEKNKIENPDYTLDQKNEKKLKTYEARDVAKRELIAEQKEIETDIEEQELELKTKELKLKKFKLEYEEQEQSWEERDENGDLVTVTKKVNVPQNANERRKLYDSIHEVIDNLTKLKEAQTQCQKYLSEIDEEYEKDVEETNKIIGNKKNKEKTETTKAEKIESKKVEPVKPESKKVEPVKPEPKKVEPVKPEPKKTEPETIKAEKKEPKDIPILKDTIKIELDANSGLAVLSRRINGMQYSVNRALEKIFDRKEEKAIRKKVVERLIEQDKGGLAKSVKRLSRKLNPAVLELLYDEEPKLMEEYIDAVRMGDKEKLPFDKYNVNLNDGVTIDEKSFTRLNRYAVRDNKNLGTEFNATQWYTVKKALNKVFPKKLPFMKKWIGELPEPAKLNDQEALIKYSQAKEKRDIINEQINEQYNDSKQKLEEINEKILAQKKVLRNPNSGLAERIKAQTLLKEFREIKQEERDNEVKNDRGAKGTSEGLRAALRYDVPLAKETQTQIIDKDKTEENTNNRKNKFKESLKVGKNSLSKVHHYTSKKLNNIKMNGKIATRKIKGYFKGENFYKVQMDVRNIEEDYMSR